MEKNKKKYSATKINGKSYKVANGKKYTVKYKKNKGEG